VTRPAATKPGHTYPTFLQANSFLKRYTMKSLSGPVVPFVALFFLAPSPTRAADMRLVASHGVGITSDNLLSVPTQRPVTLYCLRPKTIGGSLARTHLSPGRFPCGKPGAITAALTRLNTLTAHSSGSHTLANALDSPPSGTGPIDLTHGDTSAAALPFP
jgi:hypothetical protein